MNEDASELVAIASYKRLMRALFLEYRKDYLEMRLTDYELVILRRVARAGQSGFTTDHLVAAKGIDRSQAGKVLRRLTQKGYLTRDWVKVYSPTNPGARGHIYKVPGLLLSYVLAI